MTEIRDVITQIREHEASQAYGKKANERALPNIRVLVMDIDSFDFGPEDLDLKKRMMDIANVINKMEETKISKATLDSLRVESANILEELLTRYKGRMEAHASRQNNL